MSNFGAIFTVVLIIVSCVTFPKLTFFIIKQTVVHCDHIISLDPYVVVAPKTTNFNILLVSPQLKVHVSCTKTVLFTY